MAIYPKEIADRLTPRPAREEHTFDAAGTAVSFTCGSAAFADVAIGEGVVRGVNFRTNGCGFMAAAGNILAEYLENRPLSELHGLNAEELGDLVRTESVEYPADRRQCLQIAIDALRGAFENFRRRRADESQGASVLICSCFGVSEDIIEALVRKGAATVADVASACNAGSGCGSCQPLIQEVVDTLSADAV